VQRPPVGEVFPAVHGGQDGPPFDISPDDLRDVLNSGNSEHKENTISDDITHNEKATDS